VTHFKDILEKSIVWKQKEGLVKDQDRSPTQNKIIKKENSKPELKKTTDSKKEKIKEELESVDKTGHLFCPGYLLNIFQV
jgi:hypothetical protein